MTETSMRTDPFVTVDGYRICDAASRLHAIERFDLERCRQAIAVTPLQKTVEQRLRARIRKLEKEARHG
ncbi:MAG TPA: hypothetical protein VL178_07085 [Pseudomonas sp.]|nr:hypothetical protein [Pseudomonas sp.]